MNAFGDASVFAQLSAIKHTPKVVLDKEKYTQVLAKSASDCVGKRGPRGDDGSKGKDGAKGTQGT